MKKANYLHIVLELVTIFSYIVIGVTIETFVGHDVELLNKSFIGSIILAIGVTQMVEYLSMKELARLRNVPYIIVAVASMIFGIVILAVDMTLPLACVLWGSFAIGFQIIRIINSSINLQRQPFLNSFIIILCIIEIIFAIFLIVYKEGNLSKHFIFIGVSMLVQAFLLTVEFIIHRYQK